MTSSGPYDPFDHDVEAAADATIEQIRSEFVSNKSNLPDGRFGGIVMAPAGAGKTYLGASVARDAVSFTDGEKSTIVVCTPTNDQAFHFIDAFAKRFPETSIAFLHAHDQHLPPTVESLRNVQEIESGAANQHMVVVGTLDKIGDAAARGSVSEFEMLVVDEAFQADAAKYYKVAALSNRHLLIGDYGQLEPFTTMNDPDRWRGLPEDPIQTAVSVLKRNHRGVDKYPLPITRRLPSTALPVVSSFYPDHDFASWTKPGARQARLANSTANGRLAAIDASLDSVTNRGWAWARLPDTPVLTADPDTIELITEIVSRLFDRSAERSDETTEGVMRALEPGDVGVVVSHNDQKDYLRVSLEAKGLSEVRVDTANKLQGLEFEFVVAWHPLAGLPETDGFHLEPGRLCVMLTRHRHGCVVVGRTSDPDLIDDLPPAGETWIGDDTDPVLDGWLTHKLIFDSLSEFAIDVPV